MPEITDGMLVQWMTWMVTHDEAFIDLYSDVIKPEHFQTPEIQYLFTEALAYHAKFGTVLSGEALTLLLEERPDIVHFDKDVVWQMYEEAPEPSEVMNRFVSERAGNFFKRKMMRTEMNRAVDLLEENRVDDARELLEEMTSEVASVGDRDYGHAGVKDVQGFLADLRETYADDGTATASGVPSLDKMMRGGLRPGQLGVIMGAPGQGKSQALIFFMRNAVVKGCFVVYYSLEMAYREVTQRCWAGLTDMSIDEMDQDLDGACRRILKEALSADKLGLGEFVVKVYPAKQASVQTVAVHLAGLIRHEGRKPDLVIVDYADILKSGRQYDDRRDELAVVYEDLRGLATTMDVPIWTACQTNRAGSTKYSPGMEHMSDSWDKAKTADYIFALAQTDNEKTDNEIRIVPLKVRNSSASDPVTLGIDFGRSLFFEHGSAA